MLFDNLTYLHVFCVRVSVCETQFLLYASFRPRNQLFQQSFWMRERDVTSFNYVTLAERRSEDGRYDEGIDVFVWGFQSLFYRNDMCTIIINTFVIMLLRDK